MDIRVVFFVVAAQPVDDGAWFLGCGGVVKIDQGMAVNLLVEDREIVPDRFPISGGVCGLMHGGMSGRDRGASNLVSRSGSSPRRVRPLADTRRRMKGGIGGVLDSEWSAHAGQRRRSTERPDDAADPGHCSDLQRKRERRGGGPEDFR